MKFKQYLIESKETEMMLPEEEMTYLIKRDCQFYLDMVEKNGYSFLRSTTKKGSRKINPLLYKFHIKEKRDAKGQFTNKKMFELLNKSMDKLNMVRRDHCVSVTTGKLSYMFGDVFCYVFPIGKFNYSYILSDDFNYQASNGWDAIYLLGLFSEGKIDEAEEYMKKYIVTNKDIKTAMKESYEVWLDCEEYYIVETTTDKNIIKGIFQ